MHGKEVNGTNMSMSETPFTLVLIYLLTLPLLVAWNYIIKAGSSGTSDTVLSVPLFERQNKVGVG